jgi:NAD(P)-dependent dehydrogenase (short-subunit alcohol dehydrogenase family)
VGTFAGSGSVTQWSDDDLRTLFDTNVLTSAHVLSGALAQMVPHKRGTVVLVASTAALSGGAMVAAYSASKAAQLRLVESAAAEVRNAGVTVVAVLPGTMDTPQNRSAMPDADRTRWVTLAEVADVIAFLLTPAGSTLSGQPLRVSRE